MIEPERLLDILSAGKELSVEGKRELLGHGEAVIPGLVQILLDAGLADVDARGDGYAPVHAAELLGELGAVVAIEPMLQRLRETHWDTILHDRILLALPRIGAPVVEPVLRAHDDSQDPEVRNELAGVLAEVGTRDERIYVRLLGGLATDPGSAAGNLAVYGDRRALEPLLVAFDALPVTDDPHWAANQDLIELREAIQDLGGTLTPAQEAKCALALVPRQPTERSLEPAVRRERPGRNDPCWCGSEKKYKKCHLEMDALDS